MHFEAKLCPFCKKDNSCEVLVSTSCWCMNIKIPEELKLLVPPSFKNEVCICKKCIVSFKNNPKVFKSKYKL